MSLLSLPLELVVPILSYLKARDILAFSSCCRSTRAVVENPVLQYLMALEAAGLDTHQYSLQQMPMEDRLKYIERRETLWRDLGLPAARHWTIPVTHLHSHVHSLSSGLYILGDPSPNPQSSRIVGLHYLELPKCGHFQGEQNPAQWMSVSLGGEVLNIGVSLEEHDLIAVLTASASTNVPNSQSFRLHLKKFSTGEPHPMARECTIHVCEDLENGNQCVATITIAGSYLLLLMKPLTLHTRDEFFVYEWTSSTLLKRISVPSFTYRDVSFLSDDTLLLTNIRDNTLELLRLRDVGGTMPSDREVVWVAKLALPPLRPGRTMVSLSCCTDRIRKGKGGSVEENILGCRSASTRGRYGELGPHCRPDKALVQFRAYIRTGGTLPAENMIYFSFVVHREVILHLAREGAWKNGVQDANLIHAVPWHEWGPKATRWGGEDEADAAWMANIAGQRNVVNSGHDPRPICVRDYNVFSVNRMLSSSHLQADEKTIKQAIKVVIEESTTAHQDCFLDDIRSSLPYVEYTSSAHFNFDVVLICDEHIIGLTDNDDGSLSELDVFLMTPEDPPTCACAGIAA